jgi:NAD(P)H dehydrogenase (quinone)
MTKIVIIYHTGYGHTGAVAESVAKGASSVADTEVLLVKAEDVESHWDDLADDDGIIFGTPTYMGMASGPFKTFADASSKIWFAQGWANKIAAGFTNSASPSGDKQGTLHWLVTLAAQQSMIWVGNDQLPAGNTSISSRDNENWVGSSLGLMTQANADQGPDVAPGAGDHATAVHFGVRVATATARWVKGGVA